MVQPFAHAHHIIHRVAQPAIKLNNALVGGSNLQIDFRATRLPEQSLGCGNDGSRKPTTLKLRRNRQVIEPASVSFVASHDRCDHLPVQVTDQKQIWPDPNFALNVPVRIVPRAYQITVSPQCHNGFLIVRLKCSDFHRWIEPLNFNAIG